MVILASEASRGVMSFSFSGMMFSGMRMRTRSMVVSVVLLAMGRPSPVYCMCCVGGDVGLLDYLGNGILISRGGTFWLLVFVFVLELFEEAGVGFRCVDSGSDRCFEVLESTDYTESM